MKKELGKGYLGKLFLISLLSTGLVAGSTPKSSKPKSDSNPCAEEKSTKGRNYIYVTDKNLTTAGDGILLKDYVNHFTLNPKDQIDLDSLFYTKEGKAISYSIIDSRKGLENIISYLGPDSCLNGKEIAYKKYLESLLNEAKKNPADSASISTLNESVKDGCIDPAQDGLYGNGHWEVKNGQYMLIAKTETEEIPMIVDLTLNPSSEDTSTSNYSTCKKGITRQTGKDVDRKLERRKYPPKGKNDSSTYHERHSEKPNTVRYELGINAGTNEQINAKAGVGFAIGNSTRIGPYAEFVLSENERTENETVVTQRERLLVGPGTYKDRKDEITKSEKFHNLYAIGVKLSQKITKGLEGFLAGGLIATKKETDVSGKSTISYERNDLPLGETKVITNTLPRETSYSTKPIAEAGLEYNIGGLVFIGLSGKYQENNSGVKGGFGFKF